MALFARLDIVEAIDNRIEVLIDGGIRRGTDVFKAPAPGARAVAVGRPIIWGPAVDGQQGAQRVLDLLRKDSELSMKLCGCTSIEDITETMIFKRPA